MIHKCEYLPADLVFISESRSEASKEYNVKDSDIIALFFAREETAIAETTAKYGRLLQSIAYNILADVQDSEECVSDTYLQAWNSIPPQKPESLSAYLGRIVRNQAINVWHRNRAQKRYNPADVMLEELGDIIPAGAGIEEEIDANELARHISQWLRALATEDRILFVQRYWYALPLKKLAAEHGSSANKLAGRMYRLRRQLKDSLEEAGITL